MGVIDESRIQTEKEIYQDNRKKAKRKLSAYEPKAAAQALRKAADAADNLSGLIAGAGGESYKKRARLLRSEADRFEERGIDHLPESDLVSTTQTNDNRIDQKQKPTAGGPGRKNDGGSAAAGSPETQSDSETDIDVSVETPDIDFSDVGGMDEVKAEFREEIAYPVEKRDIYEQYGIEPIGGVLLQGPPGTGKTYITRALAGELGWSFIELRPSDIVSALFGESAKKVRAVFEKAKANAPCIVFFDEIDAIAQNRASGGSSTQSGQMLLTEFLQQSMDVEGDIVIFAATNAPEKVDSAVLNADRIEKNIEIPLPDHTTRKAILRVHLGNRDVPVRDVSYDEVAAQMDGFSGADVKSVAQSAARQAAQQADKRGSIMPITQKHLETAIENRRDSKDTGDAGGYL